MQVLVSTQNGERDRPGRRWQRPVANLFHTERSAGRRTPRAGRTRSLQSRIGNKISDGAFEAMLEAIQTDRTPNFYFMQDRRKPRQQSLETTFTASFLPFDSVGLSLFGVCRSSVRSEIFAAKRFQ